MFFLQLLNVYPAVSKQIRDYYRNQSRDHHHHDDDEHKQHHCCGFMALEQGLGHADLDKLMRNPEPLNFTFGLLNEISINFSFFEVFHSELVNVLRPGEYEKDTYLLNDDEKRREIPKLRTEGNELYKTNQFESAAQKYGQALQFFEDLMLKEKPNDVEWKQFDVERRPLLLNFVQCQLKLGQFYSAIEHATTILTSDPENIKARYRRAKAHVGAWNVAEAKSDYQSLLSSIKDDENLRNLVQHELQQLTVAEQNRYQEEKSLLAGKLFSSS